MRIIRTKADEKHRQPSKIASQKTKISDFLKRRKKSQGNNNQMFEIWANMWSPRNRRFCAKSIKKSRKQVKNGSFSADFWSKWRDSNSRPPVPEDEKICFLNTIIYIQSVYSAKAHHFARCFRYFQIDQFLLWSVMWSNLKYG